MSKSIIGFVGLGLLGLGCVEGPEPARQDAVRRAKIFVVGNPSSLRRHRFPGTVQASSTVELAFRVGGPLVELPAKEGLRVEEDGVLARIDPRDFRVQVRTASARLEAARAQLGHAELQLRRARRLVEHRAVSRADFDASEAQHRIALAEVRGAERALEAARLALRDTVLRAPFSGRVAAVRIENHQNVQAGQPAMQLQGSDDLEVRIDVPEAELAAFTASRAADFLVRFESVRVGPLAAHVEEYTTDIDPETKTYAVTLGVEVRPPVPVLPGMTASVEWSRVASQTGLQVPLRSVGTDPDANPIVYRLDDEERLQPVSVRLGRLSEDGVVITAGLQPGDRILAAGVRAARAGQRVRPFESNPFSGPAPTGDASWEKD